MFYDLNGEYSLVECKYQNSGGSVADKLYALPTTVEYLPESVKHYHVIFSLNQSKSDLRVIQCEVSKKLKEAALKKPNLTLHIHNSVVDAESWFICNLTPLIS